MRSVLLYLSGKVVQTSDPAAFKVTRELGGPLSFLPEEQYPHVGTPPKLLLLAAGPKIRVHASGHCYGFGKIYGYSR